MSIIDSMDESEALEEDDGKQSKRKSKRVKMGVDWELENAADAILAASRVGVTRVSDKKDYLSSDQLERRRAREVYVESGVPDSHLYSGLFRRTYNPASANFRANGQRRRSERGPGEA